MVFGKLEGHMKRIYEPPLLRQHCFYPSQNFLSFGDARDLPKTCRQDNEDLRFAGKHPGRTPDDTKRRRIIFLEIMSDRHLQLDKPVVRIS